MVWMVAVSKWNMLETAVDSLSDIGLPAYAPKSRDRVVVRGRRIWRERLLFGRYFFVYFTDWWREAFAARGVTGILMSGDSTPSLVGDETVDGIKSREDRGYVLVPRLHFTQGQHLRVTEGLFQGKIAEYVKPGGPNREIVLLDFFGQRSPVEIVTGWLATS